MEYKFRGFDAVGKKGWVYGDLVHNKKVSKTEPFLTDRIMVGGYEVVPESVGLSSGLTDCNGNDIYDGDIVQWSKDGKKYLVVFKSDMFYASVEEFNKGVYGGFPLWVLCEEEQPCAIVGAMFESKMITKKNRTMAEKKNRFRPTLTAYRALENEVSTLREELAKYKQANGKMDAHINEAMRIELTSLRSKNHTLEQSNELMKVELERLRNAHDVLIKSYALLGAEMAVLKARGFWARVFNR